MTELSIMDTETEIINLSEIKCKDWILKLKTPLQIKKSEYQAKSGHMFMLECDNYFLEGYDLVGRGHTLEDAMNEFEKYFCIMYEDAKRVVNLVECTGVSKLKKLCIDFDVSQGYTEGGGLRGFEIYSYYLNPQPCSEFEPYRDKTAWDKWETEINEIWEKEENK